MTVREHHRIHLDLDVAGDEISGRAATSGAAALEFTGWLGLIASIDALTAPAPASPGEGARRPPELADHPATEP